MKNCVLSTLVIMSLSASFLGSQGLAQSTSIESSEDSIETLGAPMGTKRALPAFGVEKYLITLDYNSWFESLTIADASGGEQESRALYYGFGLGFEKNWYRSRWGWGLGASTMAGSATGGDKAGSLAYFQARVPWWAVRVSPRLFYRWTARTDLGVALGVFYKHSQWRDTTETLTIQSGSPVVTGPFVDLRVRFSSKLEMIQSFGMVYKDQSIFWRLGMAYRL